MNNFVNLYQKDGISLKEGALHGFLFPTGWVWQEING